MSCWPTSGNVIRGLVAMTWICLVGTFVEPLAAQALRGGAGPLAKVRQLRDNIDRARASGQDVTEAERLDALSREAARRGDHEGALRLLDQAIAALGQPGGHGRSGRGNNAPRGDMGGAERPELGENGREDRPGRRADQGALSTGGMPVFIWPFVHHYNGPGGYYAPAAEVRATAEFFAKHKLPGTLFFDGILVDRLVREDPGLIDQINRWGLPLGYHGEETHGPYPVPTDLAAEAYGLKEAQGYAGPWSLITGLDWNLAVSKTQERYSHGIVHSIDPQTNRILRQQGATLPQTMGGLALVQKAFGRDVSAIPSHALESAPTGFAFRKMSRFILDQPAMPTASHALKIFGIGELSQRAMSIAGSNVSIFWHMGRLTTKGDRSGEVTWAPVTAYRTIPSLDRSQPRLLLMGFSSFREDAALETIRSLNERFFPANPGSRWVSADDLSRLIEPEKGHTLSATEIDEICRVLTGKNDQRPPDQIETGERVHSLTDAFESLAVSLSAWSQRGSLPETVSLKALYGPVTTEGSPLVGEGRRVTVAQVAQSAREVDGVWKGVSDDRFVPERVTMGQTPVNSAEFLHAMATAYLSIRNGRTTEISLRRLSLFPPYADLLDEVFRPTDPRPLCYTKGQLWTVKPARVAASASASSAASARGAASAPPIADQKRGKLLVVFASNLESDGGCYREDPSGADLYSVVYDLATRKASDLARLTRTPGQPEWFPSIAPDQKSVAYVTDSLEHEPRRSSDIRWVGLSGGSDGLLVQGGRFPAFSPDGKWLAHSGPVRGPRVISIRPIERRPDGGLAAGSDRIVANRQHGREMVEDPEFFPDGRRIVFHRKNGPRDRAGVSVIGLDGNGFRTVTDSDGSGHSTVSPDGKAVAFTSSGDGAVRVCRENSDGWSAPEKLPFSTEPESFVASDRRFSTVRRACHSYIKWVAPDLMLVTTHGADRPGHFTFSRLFLFQWTGGNSVVHDLSGSIETLAGKSGRDFCSGDAVSVSR